MAFRVAAAALCLGTAACTSVVRAPNHLPSFEAFIQLHGRSYQNRSSEYSTRRALYKKRVAAAKKQNRMPERLWNAGVNKYWDWTDEELMSLRGWDGSVRPTGAGHGSARSVRPHASAFLQQNDLPKEKIWSNLAMAKRVKDQGSCGSCWAVATASVLEGHVEIHSGKARTFSVQQIVACTPNPRKCGGTGGCQGATAELGFDYVLKHGCSDETQVPYHAQDEKCTSGSSALDMAQMFSDPAASAQGGALAATTAFGMTGWETLPKNEYEPLVRALAERGPVAVSVTGAPWFNYDNGIFNGCSKDAVIDHAVTAIGYGEEEGHKYWLIQNSWGSDWGEEGHIRLERHAEDKYCGTNNDPQKGVACEGENAPVPVCGMCGVLFDSVVPHFG